MARGTIGVAAAITLLTCALNLLGISSAAAGPPYDQARPLFNPRYAPPYPEGPWGHVPLCQVLLRMSPPRQGVSADDIWYCYLPPLSSRYPSDPCACVVGPEGGAGNLRTGMVVWTPTWWRFPVNPPP